VNGVVGEAITAEALAAPLVLEGKAVVSCDECWLAVLAGEAGLCIADSEMYVSTHFAVDSHVSCCS